MKTISSFSINLGIHPGLLTACCGHPSLRAELEDELDGAGLLFGEFAFCTWVWA